MLLIQNLLLTIEVGDSSEMFLLLEGMADGEVPLHGDDREAHDLNGLRQRVRERLHATEASVRPGLRSANGKKGSYIVILILS